jgi:hypothetical protein
LAALGACSFDASGSKLKGGDAGTVDDEPDAGGCTPAAVDCSGRQLRTCNDEGTGYATIVDCPFTCGDGACRAGANLEVEAFEACGADAPALTPPTGAALVLAQLDVDTVRLSCDPDCGDGATASIDSIATFNQPGPGGDLAYFCFSELTLPTGTTLASSRTAADRVLPALAFIVHGDATIAGTIDVSGGDGEVELAGPTGVGGSGGPGGGNGGNFQVLASAGGIPGSGRRAGDGGQASASASDTAAGGGGGGGFFGVGGDGGSGRNGAGDETAPGGNGGTPSIDQGTNQPLFGGSGGGGGADSNGGACGYPGGGGGGGLQISARRTLLVTGAIKADGGAGFGDLGLPNGGGGGGGSGGALLLQAFEILIDGGTLSVDGGDGGLSGAGAGGLGASGGSLDGTDGTSEAANTIGGAGGGGGAGRVFLQAVTEPTCAASPTASCSTGELLEQ